MGEAETGSLVEIRLLGVPELLIDGKSRPLAPMERGVLAVLALVPGRVVTVEKLIDSLWAVAAASARTRIHVLISALRRKLACEVITSVAAGYMLRADSVQVDLWGFDERVAQASRAIASGGHEQAGDLLQNALGRWRGAALAGLDMPFARAARSELEERRLLALDERIACDLELGRHDRLIGELTGLVAEHPLRERLRGHLMLALTRAGRHVDALAQFRSYTAHLNDEYGLEPSSRLRELHASILRDDCPPVGPSPAAQATSPAAQGVSPVPQGVSSVLQGVSPAVLPVPAQLPAAPGGFVGRAAELAELTRLALGQGAPLLVIAGAGGAGKTALALHFAHSVAEHFDGGQFYVDLHGWADDPPLPPLHALGAFLRALGVPGDRIPLATSEAAALLRSHLHTRRVLVLLDNAASPEQVRPLLPGNHSSLVLVTSRASLGGLAASNGAVRVALGPLSDVEAIDVLGAGIAPDRRDREAVALAEVARLCGGLPLALRLAGIQIADDPARSVAGFAERLRQGDPLSRLAIPGDPQAAVANAFRLSYLRLDPACQRTFRALGAVPGADAATATVAAVTGDELGAAEAALDQLVAAHLVDKAGLGRYTMHDLVRSYAISLSRLDLAELAAARHRHWCHQLAMADAAAARLYPHAGRLALPDGLPAQSFPDAPSALAWLDAERANLVSLVADAATHPEGRGFAWLIADRMRVYLWHAHRAQEWLAVAGNARAAAEAAGDRPGLMASLISLSYAHFLARQLPQALAAAHRAQTLAAPDDLAVAEQTHNAIGNVHWRRGNLRRADIHYRRALAAARAAGRPEVVLLISLGNICLEAGRIREARDIYERAAAQAAASGAHTIEAISLVNLAVAEKELAHLAASGQCLDRARKAAAVAGHDIESAVLTELSSVYLRAGLLDRALDHASRSLLHARESANQEAETAALNALGQAHRARGEADLARECHQEALRMARMADNRYTATVALLGVAGAVRDTDPAQALRHAQEALREARRFGYRTLQADALALLAEAFLATGKLKPALTSAHHALALSRRTGYQYIEARSARVARRARTLL
ncbi:SARP family transcriptional regulator [Rhizocola hellebori]|uniref:SARP family transcriptional regulator n=1 Tax=Rhizocola hellebori TaxID=1392758 RepID=A0A8J3QAE6_9ACTN|nr:BTAD domain-containing putative transcriptional regulator [Rhizocola hellebori]GIH06142.1 SARP family transcriptional regulator [Rhizocola hellebori]